MDKLITINKNNSYSSHGYEIILNANTNYWDITMIKATKEQCKFDHEIFYDHPDRNAGQMLINGWLMDLLGINNNVMI